LFFFVLLQLGYSVLCVNYRGSLGFSDAGIASLPGKVGVQDVHDVNDAVTAVIATHGVDAERVAVFGGSAAERIFFIFFAWPWALSLVGFFAPFLSCLGDIVILRCWGGHPLRDRLSVSFSLCLTLPPFLSLSLSYMLIRCVLSPAVRYVALLDRPRRIPDRPPLGAVSGPLQERCDAEPSHRHCGYGAMTSTSI